MRFLDTLSISATRARCIYFGKTTRERPKWLQDNPDSFRPLTEEERIALTSRTAGAVDATLPSVPTLQSEKQPDGPVVSLLLQPEHGAPEDVQLAPVMLPVFAIPHAHSTSDELIVDGRRLVSERRAAEILRVSHRTLQRWHDGNIGPPRTKVGRKNFYDLERLQPWLQTQ
jgi:hypothetical protein